MSVAAASRADRRLDGWGRLALGLVTLSAALAALLEALLVPTYAGSVIVPLAVVLGIASNVALPLLARWIGGSTGGAALPVVAWMVVLLALASITRPEGDVLLPGGTLQWVTYGLLLGGALAGAATVVLSMPPAAGRVGPPASRVGPPAGRVGPPSSDQPGPSAPGRSSAAGKSGAGKSGAGKSGAGTSGAGKSGAGRARNGRSGAGRGGSTR